MTRQSTKDFFNEYFKRDANPNATNSELDAKIIVRKEGLTDQDYLNIIQLIKDNKPDSDNTYWTQLVERLYGKVNLSLLNKRNRL